MGRFNTPDSSTMSAAALPPTMQDMTGFPAPLVPQQPIVEQQHARLSVRLLPEQLLGLPQADSIGVEDCRLRVRTGQRRERLDGPAARCQLQGRVVGKG